MPPGRSGRPELLPTVHGVCRSRDHQMLVGVRETGRGCQPDRGQHGNVSWVERREARVTSSVGCVFQSVRHTAGAGGAGRFTSICSQWLRERPECCDDRAAGADGEHLADDAARTACRCAGRCLRSALDDVRDPGLLHHRVGPARRPDSLGHDAASAAAHVHVRGRGRAGHAVADLAGHDHRIGAALGVRGRDPTGHGQRQCLASGRSGDRPRVSLVGHRR